MIRGIINSLKFTRSKAVVPNSSLSIMKNDKFWEVYEVGSYPHKLVSNLRQSRACFDLTYLLGKVLMRLRRHLPNGWRWRTVPGRVLNRLWGVWCSNDLTKGVYPRRMPYVYYNG